MSRRMVHVLFSPLILASGLATGNVAPRQTINLLTSLFSKPVLTASQPQYER